MRFLVVFLAGSVVACTTDHTYLVREASDGGEGADTQADAAAPVLPSTDAGTKKPASHGGACRLESSDVEDLGDGCTNTETYTCETAAGFDAYRVECDCPAASCDCIVNGVHQKSVAFNGCPGCFAPVALAKLCGFDVER